MATVWLRLRGDFRLRWRALAVLALLLGLVGGVVLTAAAGARRTETAYPRLLQWANASQVTISPFSNGPTPGYYTAVARLPQVAAVWTANQYYMAVPVPRGVPDTLVVTLSSPDRNLGVSADRVKILQGRLFNPGAAGQAVIDPELASLEHLQAGGTLRLLGIPNNPKTGNIDVGLAFPLAFRVTAIAVFDTQVIPTTEANSEPLVLLSPSFTATRAARSLYEGTEAGLRLRPGASMTGFVQAASALAKRYPATGGTIAVVNLSDEVAATERGIRPQAVALAVFAVLAGLIGLAVIGQLLARQLVLDSTEFPILRALGMTRGSLAALSLARLAVVTVAGAVIAVGVAIAASPLMPIGPARLAEPQPGVEVNLAVLGAGLLAIAVLPLALLARAAWRAAGRAQGPLGVAEPAEPARPSRLGSALGRAGSVPGSLGVRMAFEPGHGRTAVPVRSALAGTIVAVAAVVAAAVFGASLIALVGTPHQYGQNWNQELDLQFVDAPAAFAQAKLLSSDPAVTGYAGGDYGQLTINGKIVPAIGVDPLHGSGYLTLLAGRAPAAPDEIALGAQTLRALHRQLGQTVQVVLSLTGASPGPATVHTMRIVGEVVFPSFGLYVLSATDLGIGAAISASLLSIPFKPTGCTGHVTCYNFFLLRYRPGTDLTAAAAGLTAAANKAGCPVTSCLVTSDQRPGDIKNYAAIRDTPLVLGGVLALLAVGTLAHVLLTGVRRRRRDLAVLKTLGLVRSQVLRVVAWEASALAAAALLVGLPLGVLAGRW
ncbi:MAG TPA: FtsX-like permease family protein, partial [Streptosporangiaceae bacterium]|nr:FtsX-like permease family protein [Streptosporangiaceae bacterium]